MGRVIATIIIILIILRLILDFIRFIGVIGFIILVISIFVALILISKYIEELEKRKIIYKISDEKIRDILDDYKESNKFFKRNLDMNLDEELLFIYNIQQFIKSNKGHAKFKFLNDEISLEKINKGVGKAELIVNSKHNYTYSKHYQMTTEREKKKKKKKLENEMVARDEI
ncbi:hypothetical protein NL50_10540 [Clostridium acetobutylicum]|nr:hypothetical protein NL50_10540 [Clostridium acetobutylicum]